MPFRAADGPYTHDEEPSLDHLLNDPIVRLLMARDGVQEDTLRALLIAAARIRRQVRGETLRSAAPTPTSAASKHGGVECETDEAG
jgi:hypothetical protein